MASVTCKPSMLNVVKLIVVILSVAASITYSCFIMSSYRCKHTWQNDIQQTDILKNDTQPGTCTIKHYRIVMFRFCSELTCLPEPVEMINNINKTLAYYGICSFAVHYESVVFYSPGANVIKLFCP